jgi:hypothetical protein
MAIKAKAENTKAADKKTALKASRPGKMRTRSGAEPTFGRVTVSSWLRIN